MERNNYYLIENDGYSFKWLALQADDVIEPLLISDVSLWLSGAAINADLSQSEQLIEAGQVIGIKRLGFNDADVKAAIIFKTPFNNCTDLYCSDVVKKVVESYSLTGVVFSKDLSPT